MIDITDKRDCCGCTACETACSTHAISLKPDSEGFLYPDVNSELCVDCSVCERVCPILLKDEKPLENKPLKVFALHNKDNDIWYKSSSGGVFYSLCINCLKNGGIVYGAEYSDDFTVVHRGEITIKGVLKFRGSKYVQSDLTGVFKNIKNALDRKQEVLFSGTPCQVEGLKGYLRKPYSNLILVDILCHGVPSPKIFADYIKFINRNSLGRLKHINMKDKTFGWGYQNLRLFFTGRRSEFNTPLSNLWNKIFYDHIANRPACSKCRFTNYSRPGNLTLGDFWGIERSNKRFHSDAGISLLFVNNQKGLSIWEKIANSFDYVESNVDECRQPALCQPQPEADDRKEFWEEYIKDGFESAMKRRYGVKKKSLYKNMLFQFINLVNNKWKRNQ